ncbi:MAG: ferrous iron transporter B [Phycisphaeraceae bacterium]|nr:ferrous iron transporter B [Phycisphaeraceae bacterium]
MHADAVPILVEETAPGRPTADAVRIALLGNPNTGKSTLFNRISGLRQKTSNFPGTTLEARVTRVKAGVEGGRDGDLIDLPGVYSIELDQLESRVCREVLAGTAAPRSQPLGVPEVCVVVVDATNMARNLMLVGEVMRRRLPTVVVVNMADLAARQGVGIDDAALSEALGCEVVVACARSGQGVDNVRHAIRRARIPTPAIAVPATVEELRAWSDQMYIRGVREPEPGYGLRENTSDRVDRVLLHPVVGAAVFLAVMTGLFYVLFTLAQYPMGWIENVFGGLSESIIAAMGDGILADLLANGVIAGVGATVVFLPQICLLFFLISLLEDTGYLARAAFLMDRLLRPFGLPGHAFVPLLSSHACALPGIMACRAIPDPKQRLAAILVAPFMTCSARLPVYVMLTSLLFVDSPAYAALAFVGCYALGMVAGVVSALIARRTILRGKARPMAMELPGYKTPSLRTAFLTTVDRAKFFLKNAGTLILAISIVLWWMGSYPKVEPPQQATAIRAQAESAAESLGERPDPLPTEGHWAVVAELESEADHLEARHQQARSFTGRLGKLVEPVFAPMDWDWRICIGVMASFAAREVFVGTMSVVIAGQEEEDAANEGLIAAMRTAKRDDGVTPVFTRPVQVSLLVFFVLAMQCLPTLAVTMREAGHWKWAALQFVWMSGLAYAFAFIAYRIVASS